MYCILICVFNKIEFDSLSLLLESIVIYGNLKSNIEVLIYTTIEFMNLIKQFYIFNYKQMNFQTNNIGTIIDIFNFTLINKYTKLLYLDTCVIVKGDVTKLFNIIEKDILYVLEEGNLLNDAEDFYGGNTIPYNEIIYDQTDMS
jgi:hypothetical protein